MYYYTDSRTTFFFYLLFLIIYAFLCIIQKVNYYRRDVLKAGISIFVACMFLFPFIAVVLMKRIPWLDSWTSGRISGLVIGMRDMNLFNFVFGWYYAPLACFYYLLLGQFGIPVYLYFAFLFRKALVRHALSAHMAEAAVMMALMVAGLAEGSLFAIEEISSLYFWGLISRGVFLKNNGKAC